MHEKESCQGNGDKGMNPRNVNEPRINQGTVAISCCSLFPCPHSHDLSGKCPTPPGIFLTGERGENLESTEADWKIALLTPVAAGSVALALHRPHAAVAVGWP